MPPDTAPAHLIRRIKHSNKRHGGANPADGDGDSSDDEDDDLGLDDDGCDDGDDDDGVAEVCPPGCDQALYDKVCELREQRVDEEEAAAEIVKTADGIKKERELVSKKGKLVEQSLNAINQVSRAGCGLSAGGRYCACGLATYCL